VVLISQFVGMLLAIGLALARGETAPTPADLGWSVLAGLGPVTSRVRLLERQIPIPM
jgi:hypothetical protein